MNEHIKNLLELGVIIGGKVNENDGFITFDRLSNEELVNIPDNKMAFATKSMGRAIFTIDSEGKIHNYKGVDSHFNNDEISMVDLLDAKAASFSNPEKSYQDSTYPINLVIFPGERIDVRMRGSSPLEDLEIEANINSKMKELDIKTPRIVSIREFPSEISRKLGLPIKVEGEYSKEDSDYFDEDKTRKQELREQYGESYQEEVIEGFRAEKVSEYFKRMGILDSEELKEFANRNGYTVEEFAKEVDKSYSLGQRYGQTERIIENPFRISDMEKLIKDHKVESIEGIVKFSQSMQDVKIPVENYFAKQMGTNLAYIMNNAWLCENFFHRQDFSLGGEMCDDAYFHLPTCLEEEKIKYGENNPIFGIALDDHKRKFFSQIHFLSSNIKVLQDEMELRGKSKEEIESVLDDFVNNFTENLDMDKVASSLGKDKNKVCDAFQEFLSTSDGVHYMSVEVRDGKVQDNPAILLAHEENNDFFDKVSMKVAKKLGIERDLKGSSKGLLSSGVEASKKGVSMDSINKSTEKVVNIESERREKNQISH